MNRIIIIAGLGVFIAFLLLFYYLSFAEKKEAETLEKTRGLKIEILEKGTGQRAASNGDVLTVHYTGRLLDGTKFDSSLEREEPFAFTLGAGKVIKGWDKGLLGMRDGAKIKLTIDPELAYGSKGAGGAIPPNATLVFEIEVLKVW